MSADASSLDATPAGDDTRQHAEDPPMPTVSPFPQWLAQWAAQFGIGGLFAMALWWSVDSHLREQRTELKELTAAVRELTNEMRRQPKEYRP